MTNIEAAFTNREEKGSLVDVQEFNADWRAVGSYSYRVSDESLAYSIGALISAFDPDNTGKVSQTKFYKLLYILSADLMNRGVDIKLPYFWYRHGPVVPYAFLPGGIIELRSMDWNKYQGKWVLLRNRRLPTRIASSNKELIDDSVALLWDNYSNAKTPKIVMDVYSMAPHPFQREYKNFIKYIRHKVSDRDILCKVQGLREKEDVSRLERAVDIFDESEFPQIYDDLLQWKTLTKYSINQLSTIDSKFILDLSSIYWDKLFCMFLRVKEYRNLPDALISKWERELPAKQDGYEQNFEELETKFYSSIYRPSGGLNKDICNAYCECLKSILK
ncbi:hypothetical protein [Methanothrix harundinacea]|uniref:EF-hand domain-containing protein n=1 Tax=Methanothrix harundinacea (strain 6Ac) TaxID=1110509 RepID=G7WKI8_METH6|nr:hypothetical protein [Methanothrix harundinacea]AET64815.1 hypothetical protein Mhar_1451 [Methanothrix harundinacea 6Ac]